MRRALFFNLSFRDIDSELSRPFWPEATRKTCTVSRFVTWGPMTIPPVATKKAHSGIFFLNIGVDGVLGIQVRER